MTRFLHSLAATAIFVLSMAAPASAGAVHTDVPETVDPNARYLIYLHGARPESFPLSEPHPTRGIFEYNKIVSAFAAGGLEVISELRIEKTNPRRYARTRTLKQVNALIAKGVPAHHITVACFSKGGLMALIVATQAKQPKLNIVNMAGCGKGQFRKAYENFLANDASKMSGAKSAQLAFEEIVLEVGAGQGTFYTPRKAWMEKVTAWAKAAKG